MDPKLGALIDSIVASAGPRRFVPSPALSHFDALVRSIVYQQLSGKAAATIYGRTVELLQEVTPEAVHHADEAHLRAAGLSRGKIRFVRALADHVTHGALDLEHLAAQPDATVIDSLTAVPGIGLWTAQMFLMFRLHRPDVLPAGDLGIRKGLQRAHRMRKLALPTHVTRVGRKWAPYRSIASLYLWAAADQR